MSLEINWTFQKVSPVLNQSIYGIMGSIHLSICLTRLGQMPVGLSALLGPGEIAENKQVKSLPYGDYISWRSWRINTHARGFQIMVTPLEEIGMAMY